MKHITTTFVILIIFHVLVLAENTGEDHSDDDYATKEKISFRLTWHNHNFSNYIRCTRRFTTGLCFSSVMPVWTFVFQVQNCMERLGCRASVRENRFNTFAGCMKVCQGLINLYTEILVHDSRNLTAYLRSKSWRNSRRGVVDEDYDDTDGGEEQVPNDDNKYVYVGSSIGDGDVISPVTVPDVDRVDDITDF